VERETLNPTGQEKPQENLTENHILEQLVTLQRHLSLNARPIEVYPQIVGQNLREATLAPKFR
jgi:adenine C2-methylase RlmN of 23S rRNA A2503 and tRNA A37